MPTDRPSPETLRRLLRYDPESGHLFWRPRPADSFASADCATGWNTKYAGKRGFTAKTQAGYWKGSIYGKRYDGHRVAWAIHFGRWPEGIVDHINGDKSDNRPCNLRDVDRFQSAYNRPPLGNRRFKGIIRCGGGKFFARIRSQNKTIHLGTFACEVEAARAYDAAAVKIHGEYAWLNFPPCTPPAAQEADQP